MYNAYMMEAQRWGRIALSCDERGLKGRLYAIHNAIKYAKLALKAKVTG